MAVLLTKIPFLDLLAGASWEGRADIGLATPDLPAQMKRKYYDALSTILLYGKAIIAVPSYLTEGIDCEFLLREDLIEFSIEDPSVPFFRRICGLYQSAYSHLRAAEEDSRFAPIVSMSGVAPSEGSLIDLETDLSEASYSIDEIVRLLTPLVDQFSNEFRSVLEEERRTNLDVLLGESTGYTESLLGLPLTPEDYGDFYTTSLLHDLGLRKMSPAEYEWGSVALPYYPSDLARLWDIERAICGPRADFEDEFAISMLVGMRPDPVRFLETHSFWSAVFSLYRAICLSSSGAGTILSRCSGSPAVEMSSSPESIRELVRMSDDRVGMFKAVLLDRGVIPRIESVEDVLRLRDDVRFQSLQARISEWQSAITTGEIENVADLRAAVAAQARSAVRLRWATRVGRLVTWIGAPLAAYDVSRGTLLGLPVALIAPLVDIVGKRLEKRHSWTQLGT